MRSTQMRHTAFGAFGVFGAPFQCLIRRLIARYCNVSKQRNLCLELYDRSESRQAHRKESCRCSCQIAK